MIKTQSDELKITDLIKLLCSKFWIIIISAILSAAIAFSASVMFIPPKYTSTAMMYVNNSSLSVGSSTITFSSSQISAAKSLLNVYVVILKTRTTLERVIELADLDYTYSQLRGMISAGSVSGTEIFSISATCPDGKTAELIVDTIVKILPERISTIVKGSSVEIVDEAREPTYKSSPSYTYYAALGMFLGAVASAVLIVLIDLRNNTIKSDDDLKKRYNIPILALVPNANDVDKRGYYGYGEGYRKYGDYGKVNARNDGSFRNTERKDGGSK